MASVLETTGCRNARALIKARELIDVMGHCSFFSPTASDRLARQSTARDAWGFIVNQAQGKIPARKSSKEDDPFSSDGNDEFERYSLLPFIRRFWKGEPADLKRIDQELSYYAEKYHPETDQERAAITAAGKIYSAAYDDAEMQEQTQILIDAIATEQVKMANLATCIDPLITLMDWKVIPHDTVDKLQPHIEHAIRAHCAEAYAIIENDPFWGSRTEGAKAQAYFKQLRSYIADVFRNEETRGITDSVNSSSDTSGLQLSRYITKRLELGHFSVSQIPLDFFIECATSSSVQSLIELQKALHRIPRGRASTEDQKWAHEAISRLERIAPATNMKKVHLDALITRLREDWKACA